MRQIKKEESLNVFEEWKKLFEESTAKEAKYCDLRGNDYHNVKMALINEQYGLCCYCCKEILDYNSHIEHFKPQSQFPDESTNYHNMFASCNGYKEHYENCGHKKDNWYSEYFTVSPLEEKCEELFEYTIDGHIKPQNDNKRAEKTINELELDSDLLQRARRTAIYISGLFDEDFDETKKNKLIAFFSNPHDGKLEQFCTAITHCLVNFA